jgi:hypothetical protein
MITNPLILSDLPPAGGGGGPEGWRGHDAALRFEGADLLSTSKAHPLIPNHVRRHAPSGLPAASPASRGGRYTRVYTTFLFRFTREADNKHT